MMTLPSASEVSRHLRTVRSTAPLVHCITNTVVQNITANALLAVGASPAMVDIVGEAGPFARVASGLLVNLGTPSPEQRAAAVEATEAAADAATPWVLDPVAVGTLPVRTLLARRLAETGPRIIRGNPSEIAALAGSGQGGRGTDSAIGVDEVLPDARSLAARTGAVVVVSGAVDAIVGGSSIVRVPTGTPLLTRITGGGCALGAVIAAFAGACRDDDPATVATSAVAVYTIAAERAARAAAGPGSFAVSLLDELAALDDDAITRALDAAAAESAAR